MSLDVKQPAPAECYIAVPAHAQDWGRRPGATPCPMMACETLDEAQRDVQVWADAGIAGSVRRFREVALSQASQEAREVEDAVRAILAAVRDAARGYHNTQQWGDSEYGQPSYWERIEHAEETAIKVVRAALLSHPPKGGAKPEPIKDEDYPHSLDDSIRRMEFLAIEGIAGGSRPRIGGLCLSVAEHLGRLKSLEEGVRGPVARGGLPVPAAQNALTVKCLYCSKASDLGRGAVVVDLQHLSSDRWYCASCRDWKPAIRVMGDLLCACGYVIASYQASSEASEPAPSPIRFAGGHSGYSDAPKPSQGRECWVLFAKKSGKVLHACNDYDGPTDWSDREWKRMVEAEVVEPQERGGDRG
jgi:hypothetical protein